METPADLILASGSPRRKELLERAGYAFEVITSDANELDGGALAPAELAMHNAQAKAASVAAMHPDAIVIGADTIVVLDGRVFGKPRDADDARRMLRELSGNTHQVITGVCIARRSKQGDPSVILSEQGDPSVILSEQGGPSVIPSERDTPSVILSEQSEPKDPSSTRGPSAAALRASAQDDENATPASSSAQDDECAPPASSSAQDDIVALFAEVTDVVFRELDDDEIDAYVTTGEPLDKAGAYGIQGLGGALVDHIDGDYDNVVGLPVTRLQRTLDLERGQQIDNGKYRQ